MTTCHGCQRPLDKTAEGYVYCGEWVYHMGCEPMGPKFQELYDAVMATFKCGACQMPLNRCPTGCVVVGNNVYHKDCDPTSLPSSAPPSPPETAPAAPPEAAPPQPA